MVTYLLPGKGEMALFQAINALDRTVFNTPIKLRKGENYGTIPELTSHRGLVLISLQSSTTQVTLNSLFQNDYQ